MPQSSQMVPGSMVGVIQVSLLPRTPLRGTVEWRPWLEGGIQRPLSLLMLLIRSPLHISKMCRGAVINVTKRSFQYLQFTHTLVRRHSQKLLVPVKSSCLEHMVRFFSFPLLWARHAEMLLRENLGIVILLIHTCVAFLTVYKTHTYTLPH